MDEEAKNRRQFKPMELPLKSVASDWEIFDEVLASNGCA